MIDFAALDRLTVKLNHVLETAPERRAELHKRLAAATLAEVHREIGGRGKVAGWQGSFVGTRGGYAAVRARRGSYISKGGKKAFAIGHITNAIENGRRFEGGKTHGKQFYSRARITMAGKAVEEVDRFVDELIKLVEEG